MTPPSNPAAEVSVPKLRTIASRSIDGELRGPSLRAADLLELSRTASEAVPAEWRLVPVEPTEAEALRGEVERLRVLAKANNDLARHETQARTALQSENAKLKDALQPFADAADDLEDAHKDGSPIWEAPCAMSIDAGDLRCAKSALLCMRESQLDAVSEGDAVSGEQGGVTSLLAEEGGK